MSVIYMLTQRIIDDLEDEKDEILSSYPRARFYDPMAHYSVLMDEIFCLLPYSEDYLDCEYDIEEMRLTYPYIHEDWIRICQIEILIEKYENTLIYC